jgi:hypothetical protein
MGLILQGRGDQPAPSPTSLTKSVSPLTQAALVKKKNNTKTMLKRLLVKHQHL